MEYTRELAEFCAGVSLAGLPGAVVRQARLCALDYFANVYGSLELEAVQAVVDHARSQAGPPDCSVLGCAFKSGMQGAAFVNGTTAEAMEAQDGLRFGGNHPVCAVLPAALAVAEKRGLGGAAVVEAVVTGYEVANRVSWAVHPLHTFSGFLPTGTCGTFGAAAAAAKLLGLDGEGFLNALGVAGYLVPLSMAEQLMGGYTIKIVQGGQAASAGLLAAHLAAEGITGDPLVLEGSELNGGFTQITINGDAQLDRITDGLGEHYTIMDIYRKPYTSCRHTHGAVQATLEIMRESSFPPGDVEQVRVHTYGIAAFAVGKGVEGGTFVSAQFSIPYVVAAAIMDGDLGPAQLTERRMADDELMALVARVEVLPDEELNKIYPDKTASRVEIRLKGGTVLEKQVDIPKGDPRDPMEEEELAGKLKRFAGGREGRDADRIIDLSLRLQELGDIRELTEII
jgi:2-methylcitrate dehydratase PrpD